MMRLVMLRGGPRAGETTEVGEGDARLHTWDWGTFTVADDGRRIHPMVTYRATGEMDGDHEVWVVGADHEGANDGE